MKYDGKILVIGLGAVSRCTLPLLLKHLEMDRTRITVIDFADVEAAAREVMAAGVQFQRQRITRENLGAVLSEHVGAGDLIIDLAWNIGCNDIVQWCRDHDVMYVNASIEEWEPCENARGQRPAQRTLYARHMSLRKMMGQWPNRRGATAVLDHGANPGLVQHFVKQALEDIAGRWLYDHPHQGPQRERIEGALGHKRYNRLAMELGIKTIHISERDTQISGRPKEVNEFVNTWSVEGFREEGVAPAEMGWGTHERMLPPYAQTHEEGPRHQICLAQMGCRTWVRSWVPGGPIVGMVIRHGEAFSLAEHLSVNEHGVAVYRPTVHYAYCPCDAAIASLHELHMRNYDLQPRIRIMDDDIISGQDILGCLLMGHDYKSWWIGSMLSIEEARKLVPGRNATTLQVAAGLLGAVLWMLQNRCEGVRLPDELPHDFVLERARPYLGQWYSRAVSWTPLDDWSSQYERFGVSRPAEEDVWQFNTFLVNGISGNGY